ncbi:MAG: hypothetical protein LBP22_06345 [Deltaproteobacteria bacterium]|jgi:hypothetical protein|nr:hypothetical protein [Deltaproteobacteria bacterium]
MKHLILALTALLLPAFFPAAVQAQNQTPPGADTAGPDSKLTILPQPEDAPETARFKAALRLLAGFSQVLTLTKECARQDVWVNYQNRNGRTFSHVFRSLQAGGAFSKEYKDIVESYVRESAQETIKQGCDSFIREVESGSWDLYKAPRFNADYNLFSKKR